MYTIQPTSCGGRGAIATEFLAKGTVVLLCPGPYAQVVLRKFRKEVCEWCFNYATPPLNKWSIKASDKDGKASGETGSWFCSESCRAVWCKEAWVLDLFARFEKRVVRMTPISEDKDHDALLLLQPENISAEYLDQAWATVEIHRFPPLSLDELEIDTAKFLLSALVSKASNGLESWADFLSLQNNELAYIRQQPFILSSHIRVFRFLRAVCASFALLSPDLDTPDVVRAILGRDPGNVFGIWEDTGSDEAEMFGWAAYVAASFFNHACTPNLKKRRLGRAIEFYTLCDVRPGEELCISYIGESDVDRNRLLQEWFFQCRCRRCV